MAAQSSLAQLCFELSTDSLPHLERNCGLARFHAAQLRFGCLQLGAPFRSTGVEGGPVHRLARLGNLLAELEEFSDLCNGAAIRRGRRSRSCIEGRQALE